MSDSDPRLQPNRWESGGKSGEKRLSFSESFNDRTTRFTTHNELNHYHHLTRADRVVHAHSMNQTMKNRYHVFQRGWGTYYCEDLVTKKQTTLRTRDKDEAFRLVAAKIRHLARQISDRQLVSLSQVYDEAVHGITQILETTGADNRSAVAVHFTSRRGSIFYVTYQTWGVRITLNRRFQTAQIVNNLDK